MNLYWLLLNAVLATAFGATGAILAAQFERRREARARTTTADDSPELKYRRDGIEAGDSQGNESNPEHTRQPAPSLESLANVSQALSRLATRQSELESRLDGLAPQLVEPQHSEIDLLRRQVQQQLSSFRGEIERLEKLLNKGQLNQTPGRPSRAFRRKQGEAATQTTAIGLLALEVNGLRKEYPVVANTRMTLGRSSNNDIVLQDMRLSATHVSFRSDDTSAYVEPLGAANPVLLNERRLVKPTTLRSGDVLSFGGNSRLTFRVVAKDEGELESAPALLERRTTG